MDSLQKALERKWVVPDGEDKGEVKTYLDRLCRSMVDLAIGGSVPAAQWVGDRLEGRVTSKVEVSGGSSQIVVVPWLPATQDAILAAQAGGGLDVRQVTQPQDDQVAEIEGAEVVDVEQTQPQEP
jgi:hypothetical protein